MKKFLIAAAAAASRSARALVRGASAQEKLKIGFIYVGPIGDMGWSYQHEVGRRALVEQFKDKIDTSYLENVNEGPDAERSIEQLVRTGHKLIYTTSFGFMDATAKVAKKYPNVMFEHATGYKRDKNLATYSGRFYEGRYIHGPDRRQDVEDRHDRLHRLVPDPRSRLRHQRHDARRAVGAPRHEGEDHLGEHLVRPRQGSGRRARARRPGRRHPHPAHGFGGRDAVRQRARHPGVRAGLRHDQVRPEGAAHRDHQQLDAVLRRSRQARARQANGRPATCGAD